MIPSSKKLTLERLALRDVRNLEPLELELGAELNVIFGDNGHGKTSLLEAAYLVATTKSFRAARAREATRYGASDLHVRAVFQERSADHLSPLDRAQTVTIAAGTTHATIEGNRPATLAAYASRSPVIVFHPAELALSSGPAGGRRRLLDRIALYARPSDAPLAHEYARAMRARQDLLRRGASGGELDAYERICAETGAKLSKSRSEAARSVIEHVLSAFREIGDPKLSLTAAFDAGGSEDPEVAARELFERRRRDERLQAASWGPHKDDLTLFLDGHAARKAASQGQHRTLTLALKAAEANAVRAVTGIEPIQLLDDVSSELDPERTRALLGSLASSRAQILVSTTRPELIREHFTGPSESRAYEVVRGRVQRAS